MPSRPRRSRLERHVWLLVACGTVASVALEQAREQVLGSSGFRFLLWNLFLAWIPPLLAVGLRAARRAGLGGGIQLLLGVFWLLFLPNSPYLVTDFVHLRSDLEVPRSYDIPMVGVFGVTGLLLGFLSLFVVQSAVRERFGERLSAWFAGIVLALTGVGIYLGRHLEWNSWDVLVRPERRLAELVPHFTLDAVAHAVVLSGVTAVALGIGYASFYALLRSRLEPV